MNIEIEFERECYKCYGTAAWMADKQCDRCGGKGSREAESRILSSQDDSLFSLILLLQLQE